MASVFSSAVNGDAVVEDAAPSGSSGEYKMIVGQAVSATEVFVRPFTDDVAAQ